MKYLLLIVLIGIAIYYAMKWQSPSSKNNTKSNSHDDPYKSNSNNSNTDSGPYVNNGNNSPKSNGTNYAKWIGGGLGWAFGGPIGGILGFMFGSMVGGSSSAGGAQIGQTRAGDFNISLLILTASVMKADGKVTRSELDYVKQFLVNNFGAERAPQYVKILGDLVKQDYNLQEVSSQIKQYMDYSSRLMLIQFMFGIAQADGNTQANEVDVIQLIANYLGINNNDYASIKAMFIKDTNSAYKILEISEDASDEELKKAYRELAKKYHPDKVAHLGEEVKKAAEVKITALNAAYDAIKDERGIK